MRMRSGGARDLILGEPLNFILFFVYVHTMNN
jgi:hypothetical protein